MVALGDNIRKARKSMGLTQEELAAVIGVTSQAVSRWESGAGMPDISMLIPLARALQTSIDKLLGYEQEDTSESAYIELKKTFEKIEKEYSDPIDAANAKLEMLEKEIEITPGDFIYLTSYVEKAAALTRLLYDTKAQEAWPAVKKKAIRYGTQVLRFCSDTEWIERTHYALAFVYMADKDFVSSREHVMCLPSVDSNRLMESVMAQLTYAESGIDDMNKVTLFNLQKFARAVNKEVLYAAETLTWNQRPDETLNIALWGIELIKLFQEKQELIPYCRGFLRDIYKTIIVADLQKNDNEAAKAHWAELKAGMQEHYDYYRKVLSSDEEQAKFTPRQIERMRTYTEEYMADKQEAILQIIKKFFGDEAYSLLAN
jgi:transcriptional regulator with XRE-family HTH domain